MRRRSFIAFSIVTLLLVVAAVYAVDQQRGTTVVHGGMDPVFPALAKDVNAASQILITDSKGVLTIDRKNDGWVLVEKQDYPVDFDKVKTLLVRMADLKFFEEKTANPERYPRLEVEDVKAKGSKSIQVTVKDSGGKVLADGIIGRGNTGLFGSSGGGTYVRKAGEKQSWLADGTVQVGRTANAWMVRRIIKIPYKEVARMTVRQPDGALLVVHKEPKDKNLTVDDIPEGRKLKKATEANIMAEILNDLDLEDVKKESDLTWPEKPIVAEVTTYDGLVVTIETIKNGDDYWARFKARSEATGDDEAKKKVEERVKNINSRVTGWAYNLAPGHGESVTKKMSELLEEEKKPS